MIPGNEVYLVVIVMGEAFFVVGSLIIGEKRENVGNLGSVISDFVENNRRNLKFIWRKATQYFSNGDEI